MLWKVKLTWDWRADALYWAPWYTFFFRTFPVRAPLALSRTYFTTRRWINVKYLLVCTPMYLSASHCMFMWIIFNIHATVLTICILVHTSIVSTIEKDAFSHKNLRKQGKQKKMYIKNWKWETTIQITKEKNDSQ